MCFSASASFTASAGLATLSGASFAVAKKEEKILAAIPLLFAIQQFCEGVQWIYIAHGSISFFAAYGFVFFAFLLWPVYVPTFVYVLDKHRQKFLRWFIYLGIFVATYFFVLLIKEPLIVIESNKCIAYHFAVFPLQDLVIFSYILVILGPLLFSDIHAFRWFGIVIGLSAIFSWIVFAFAFTSIWCFFAAITSALFLVYVWKDRYLDK